MADDQTRVLFGLWIAESLIGGLTLWNHTVTQTELLQTMRCFNSDKTFHPRRLIVGILPFETHQLLDSTVQLV